MKTALQELIEWTDKMLDSPMSLTFSEIDFRTLYQFREKFESLLEMEKEQMKQSALSNVTKSPNLRNIFEKQFEQYYNDRYKTVSK